MQCHDTIASSLRRQGHVVPGTSISLLSWPSKMPGPSWSLPAHRACPSAHGEICSHCYASKGKYPISCVRKAQEARFRWTRDSLRHPDLTSQWQARLISAISASRCRYFRIHDSGDFFSISYIQAWHHVCLALPHIRFWAPTREWQSPSPAGPFPLWPTTPNPRLLHLQALASLPNVTIRPSALGLGDPPPSIPGLSAGSTVEGEGKPCYAYRRGGHCGNCRHCWTRKSIPISYPLH